jgi:hypothetical protein
MGKKAPTDQQQCQEIGDEKVKGKVSKEKTIRIFMVSICFGIAILRTGTAFQTHVLNPVKSHNESGSYRYTVPSTCNTSLC